MIILQMLKIQQTVTYYTDKDHKLYLPVAIYLLDDGFSFMDWYTCNKSNFEKYFLSTTVVSKSSWVGKGSGPLLTQC